MPKFRYELGHGDDYEADDDGPIYQRSRSPKRVARSAKSKVSAKPTLLAVKRQLVAAQSGAVTTAVTEALRGSNPPATRLEHIDVAEPEFNVLAVSRAVKIFKEHFVAPRQPNDVTRAGFNNVISDYLRQRKREQPTVALKLGTAALFGPQTPHGAGMRFVGITVHGQDVEALQDESRDMVSALNASEFCHTSIDDRNLYTNRRPHIRVAMSGSHQAALALLERVQGSNLVGHLQQEFSSPENPQGLVILDPATPIRHALI